MKILFVVPTLANGGAEKVCVNVATGLYDLGHDVKIVTTKKFVCDYQLQYDIHISLYDEISRCKGPFKLAEIKTVRKMVKLLEPDFTVSFMHHTNLMTYVATLGLSTRFVATNHVTLKKPDYVNENWWNGVVKRKLICLYPNLTVLTEADQKMAVPYNKHVVVMPNPHDVHYVDDKIEKSKRVVLAGRLEAWHTKGFDLAIKAWGRIQTQYPEWTMEIYGRGEQEAVDYLEKLIEECQCKDRVLLKGFTKNIHDVYRSSEVFLMSSRFEGFGLALLEAMACGCACVVCDYMNNQKGFCTNDEGDAVVYADTDNVESIVQGLSQLLEDRVLRESKSQMAIAQSKKYTVEELASKWEKYLMEIEKEHG